MRRTTAWALLALATAGCSVAREDVVAFDAATDRGSGAAVDAGAAVDVGTAVDAGGGAVDVPTGRVVINEIRATGDDWVELVNVGEVPVDLGGMVLADTDTEGDGGTARVAEGARFPAATWVVPGQRVLVVADLGDAGAGVQMRCLGDAGPMTCFHAGFGISASRGETIFLVGRDGAVVASAAYPADAAPEGRSWGRLPDGTGSFAANRPTPGGANAAP